MAVKYMILKGKCNIIDFLDFADMAELHPVGKRYGQRGLAKIYDILLQGNSKPYLEVTLDYLYENFVIVSEEAMGECYILNEPLPKRENLYSLRKHDWLWDKRKEEEEV